MTIESQPPDQRTERDIARARGALRRWGPGEVNAAFDELVRRGRESEEGRTTRRWLSLAGAVAGAGLVLFGAIHLVRRQPAQPQGPDALVLDALAQEGLTLDDGEEVIPTNRAAQIQVMEKTASRVVVSLRAGGARFRIRHDERRIFRVQAGAVQIDDVGTTFRVEHRGMGRVRVWVTDGEVAVSYLGANGRAQRRGLGAGQDGIFPDDPPVETVAVTPPPAAVTQEPAGVGSDTKESWRTLARAGQYAGAFRLMARRRFGGVRDDPSELLLAADVARLSHHAGASVQPLRQFLTRHPNDPRSAAAAFTLGWVLLNDLHRPREAAVAFARAERTAPLGNLAEDAAARCAEAWYQAGDLERADQEVRRYTRTYPRGRYQALLDRLIGGR
jgi:transmembrane sensor